MQDLLEGVTPTMMFSHVFPASAKIFDDVSLIMNVKMLVGTSSTLDFSDEMPSIMLKAAMAYDMKAKLHRVLSKDISGMEYFLTAA